MNYRASFCWKKCTFHTYLSFESSGIAFRLEIIRVVLYVETVSKNSEPVMYRKMLSVLYFLFSLCTWWVHVVIRKMYRGE